MLCKLRNILWPINWYSISLNGEFYDFLIKNEIQQFIRDHEYADINTLLLNPPKLIQAWKKEVIASLVARKKYKTKLPNTKYLLPFVL